MVGLIAGTRIFLDQGIASRHRSASFLHYPSCTEKVPCEASIDVANTFIRQLSSDLAQLGHNRVPIKKYRMLSVTSPQYGVRGPSSATPTYPRKSFH